MKWITAFLGLFVAALNPGVLAAQDVPLDFVRGLRERGYFDYALLYLDQLATRPGLSEPTKQVLPYERAVTLVESSKIVRSPERQNELLDQAIGYLEQFAKESPDHPAAGNANSERAKILLRKAEVEVLQSKAPANASNKSALQQSARNLINQARQVFATAAQQHEQVWNTFPKSIDADANPQQFEARAKSETNMVSAQLSLALCGYEEAQTYDVGSAEHKKLLSTAAEDCEKLYQRYRTLVAGLYARLYQGKCFEEQGDLQKAMGIYNELLAHEGERGTLQGLKIKAFLFRLVCLNAKTPPDSQLVIDEAEQWLKTNKSESRGLDGLGVQWELARAYEALGDLQKEDKENAERVWRQARNYAAIVSRFPNDYKDLALAMTQRLEVKLGGRERAPEKFDAAYGLGRLSFDKAQELRKELDVPGRSPEELKKLQTDLDNELLEAAKMFELALGLAGSQDDLKSVNTARFLLAYTNFFLRRNYEAAILGGYVARISTEEDGPLGLDAAYLALAALNQAYIESGVRGGDREGDIRLLIKAANLITTKWPSSDRANDARMSLGRLYSQMKRPAEAARWFGEIPDSDPKYADAQIAAGQAYWSAYVGAARLPQDQRPTPEQLAEYQGLSETFLTNGITKSSASLPKEGNGTPELLAAKVSLSALMISRGKEAEAMTLLTQDPHSVIKGVAVPNEAERPEKGVLSRQFAAEAYKLLMRAQIGVGQTDLARQTMQSLEGIVGGGGGGGADLTELYVGLGKLLREELNRFQVAGETERFDRLMNSFETFMGDVSSRSEGQSLGSLSWIAETYFALGEATSADQSRAAGFFDKANTALQSILSEAQAKPDFATPEQLLAAKVRLVRCYRARRDYEPGVELIAEVLKSRANDLKTQVEAAQLYLDWGRFGTEPLKQIPTSIKGNAALKIWGWANLSQRLQVNLSRKPTPELREAFFDVRCKSAIARLELAKAQTDAKKQKKEFEAARAEVQATTILLPQMDDEEYAILNDLYRQVQSEAGDPLSDLPRTVLAPPPVAAVAPEAGEDETAKTKAKSTGKNKKKAPVPPAKPAETSMVTIIVVSLIGLAATVGIVWSILFRKKPERVPHLASATGGLTSNNFTLPPEHEKKPRGPAGPKATGPSGAPAPRKVPRPEGAPRAEGTPRGEGAPRASAPGASGGEKPAAPRPRTKPPEARPPG